MNGTNKSINSTTYVKTCYILDDQLELITGFPTNKSVWVHSFALIFVVVLIFTTISLNGITVITIKRSRELKEKQCNFTILMQSVVDLVNGVLVLPLLTAHLASQAAGAPQCVILYIAKKSTALTVLYSLTALSAKNFERYMGILHPFHHRIAVTNKRLLAYVVVVCVIQTIICSFTLTHKQIARPVLVANLLIFLLTTVFVYWKIFFTMHEKNRTRDENSPQSNQSKTASKKARLLKELKLAKSSCLVVACCLVCCVPATLTFGPLNRSGTVDAVMLKMYIFLLAISNSTMNSIIYFWMNNMLRKHGIDMVKNIWKSLKGV